MADKTDLKPSEMLQKDIDKWRAVVEDDGETDAWRTFASEMVLRLIGQKIDLQQAERREKVA